MFCPECGTDKCVGRYIWIITIAILIMVIFTMADSVSCRELMN